MTTSICFKASAATWLSRPALRATSSSIPASRPRFQSIREAIAALSNDAPDALINTHWHYDHTDGNEGMHAAGFTIFAHQNTRERLSTSADD